VSATTKVKISKPEIEKTIAWLLAHKQKDVQAVLRAFRKLAPNKQKLLDRKLVYLASILDHALKGQKGRTRARTRCKSCGHPMHVKWFGCQNPLPDAGHAARASMQAGRRTLKRKS